MKTITKGNSALVLASARALVSRLYFPGLSVSKTFIRLFLAACACLILPASLAAEEPCVPRGHHPWGRYQPESWKRVRVVTETLDATGAVTTRSTTETITTLGDVTKDGFTVEVDVVVEVEGKQFESPPQKVQHGYCGQKDGQHAEFRRAGEVVLMIGGDPITCEKREITIVDGAKMRLVTIFYSPTVSPYVLRRESSSTDGDGEPARSVTEVVALNEDFEVLGEQIKTARLKTTFTQGKSSRVTVETVSDAVPGGVVRHTSQETDDQGRVVRRSTLELLGYEVVEEPEEQGRPPRRRLFGRRNRVEEERRPDDNAGRKTRRD